MSSFPHACGAAGPLILDITGPWSERHTVAGPMARIGRLQGSDVVMDHPEVGRRHTYLQVIAGRLFRLDLGGRPGATMGWVDLAEPIPVGPFQIRARLGDGPVPDPPTAPDDLPNPLSAAYASRCASHPAVSLAISDGRGAMTMYPVTRVLTLIGRAPACKIRLEERAASLYYGALLRTPDGPWFVDLLSSAGVAVNGRRVATARLLPGDTMQVDRYVMTVRSAGSNKAGRGRPSGLLETLPAALQGQAAAAVRPQDWSGTSNCRIEPTAHDLQPLLGELAQMHERTCEQFREVILGLTQLFGSMQTDQMRAVREQIEEIRTLAGTIRALQAAPAGASPAPTAIAAPAIAAMGNAGQDDAGGPETFRPDPREIDALIGERLARYETEREQRWNKLLRTLTGR
jgi:pSer/pThr/pTyr-binding forkhead associated (FHA) protein